MRTNKLPNQWILLALTGLGSACVREASTEPSQRPVQPGLVQAPPRAQVPGRPAGVAGEALAVEDRLLPWDAEREALTLAYRAAHQGESYAADSRIEPQVIVLHWTGGSSADSAWQTFAPARLSGRPELQGAGALNVSAHYLVDRDGRVERLLPDTTMARHTIGLNHVAIGIENVGDGGQAPLTPAQIAANAALVRRLVALHPGITHLIGHHEADRLRGTPLFVELDPDYRNPKADPGSPFMARVRAQVADLGLQGP